MPTIIKEWNSMKQYNVIQNSFPANPRSKKRRQNAQGGNTVSGSSGGGSFAGGSLTVEAEFDIIQGDGVSVVKNEETGLVYTISHGNTTEALPVGKTEKKAIAGIDIDGFGHILGMEKCDVLALDDLDKRYLRKDMNDTGAGFYTWEAGWMTEAPVRSAIYNIGWEQEDPAGWYVSEAGTAWFSTLNVRGPILSDNIVGSPYYASGWTGFGSQWDLSKHFLETDYGSFRKEIRAKMFVIDQIRGTNGSLAVSDSNKVSRVEDKGDVWRCHIDTYGGDVFMNMRVDDAVRCQRVVKYYLALVTNVSADYFDLSKTNLEGTGIPEAGDEVLRWDNVSDPDRKGIIYLTASDSYAPYMDVRYGDWDAAVGTIKVRNGRLDGINDPFFPELYGARNNFGLYTSNFYGTGELILRSTGESVSRTFDILKDRINMGFNELREEVYVSADNVLQNSTFLGGTTDFWEFENVAYPITIAGNVLLTGGNLFSNLVSGAQIVSDSLNGRAVLQVTNTIVTQRNTSFNNRSAGKYAITFSYRPVVPYGLLTVGINGSPMAVAVPLSDTSRWQRAEIFGDWDGTGDFIIQVEGGGIVNIVDISFADDRLTNAISNIKVEYDTKLNMKADNATLTSFRDEYDEFDRIVRRDYATQSWTATKINTEVGTIIDGKLTNYSTISQTSSAINAAVNNLNLGQYATTSWTSSQIRNEVGNLNLGQYATTTWTSSQITNAVKNKADNGAWASDLTQTAGSLTATFTEQINGVKGITEAFYKFDINRMSLNRRIEAGSGSAGSFTCQSGISPNTNGVAFWAGGTYAQAVSGVAKMIIYHDGSGKYTGAIQSASSGRRIAIDPSSSDKLLSLYNGTSLLGKIGFDPDNNYAYMQIGESTGSNLHLSTAGIRYSGCSFLLYHINGKVGMSGNWASASEVSADHVYKDSSGYLRVK